MIINDTLKYFLRLIEFIRFVSMLNNIVLKPQTIDLSIIARIFLVTT